MLTVRPTGNPDLFEIHQDGFSIAVIDRRRGDWKLTVTSCLRTTSIAWDVLELAVAFRREKEGEAQGGQ